MGLSNKQIGPKLLTKIQIYILTRAELLFTLCSEIPCIWLQTYYEKAVVRVGKKLVKFDKCDATFNDKKNFDGHVIGVHEEKKPVHNVLMILHIKRFLLLFRVLHRFFHGFFLIEFCIIKRFPLLFKVLHGFFSLHLD